MNLDGIEFPNIWCAPGARNFERSGWWYGKFAKLLPGYTWDGTGFVTKTTTLNFQKGNMPLKRDGKTPKQKLPRCIKVYPFSGHVLNAVGLSGHGMDAVLAMLREDPPDEPFMLSIMCVGKNHMLELQDMLVKLDRFRKLCPVPFIIQLNLACPNTGEDLTKFYEELGAMLDCFEAWGLKVFLNFNATVPVEVLQEADKHPACLGFWIANSIPWMYTDEINWNRFTSIRDRVRHRKNCSPIPRRLKQKHHEKLKEGGLSGPACRHLTVRKVREARRAGVKKPIIAGNGMQKVDHLDELFDAGATGVAFGVVGMLRPWRLKKLIGRARYLFG